MIKSNVTTKKELHKEQQVCVSFITKLTATNNTTGSTEAIGLRALVAYLMLCMLKYMYLAWQHLIVTWFTHVS